MAKKEEKTNVMRILDGKRINYQKYTYENGETMTGLDIATLLNQDPNQVFKTLVTFGSKTKSYYVFVIPVNGELDLKAAAKAVGEKSIEMIKQKDLLPLTGYMHGGCSPIGMKKQFTTVVHNTAETMGNILFSGGKIGMQVELKTEDFKKIINIKFADITD